MHFDPADFSETGDIAVSDLTGDLADFSDSEPTGEVIRSVGEVSADLTEETGDFVGSETTGDLIVSDSGFSVGAHCSDIARSSTTGDVTFSDLTKDAGGLTSLSYPGDLGDLSDSGGSALIGDFSDITDSALSDSALSDSALSDSALSKSAFCDFCKSASSSSTSDSV